MSLSEEGDGSSLLVFINEGDDDDLSIKNQFDEVRDPLEVGIWSGIPNIEPKWEVTNAPTSRFECPEPVQRSPPLNFVRWIRGDQVTKFIEHGFLFHRTRAKSRILRRRPDGPVVSESSI